jgi:hypothetical protein
MRKGVKKYLYTFTLLLNLLFVIPACTQSHYSSFYPYLRDISGWKAEKPTGASISTPIGKAIYASRTYTNGEKSITATIASGTQAYSMWAPFTMGVEIDTPENFLKIAKINGYSVGISYNKPEKNNGGVVVALKRETNEAIAVFALSFSNVNYEEALNLAEGFDWDSMSKLF